MRVGHKYVVATPGAVVRATIARDAAQHWSDNYSRDYSECASREEFLASSLFAPWVHELHACYRRVLGDAGRILSIGSGMGEHDVLLHMAGYDVTATDLIPDLAETAHRWFPNMPCRRLDALDAAEFAGIDADCVLVSGLDYALDEAQLDTLLRNLAALLARSAHARPRLVFTVRYRDNLVTRVIDQVLLPIEARLRLWLGGPGNRLVKRAHGYRRTPHEVVVAARGNGFQHRTTCYAGHGVEFQRSSLLVRVPFLKAIDSRLHVASNCVVLVFDVRRSDAVTHA